MSRKFHKAFGIVAIGLVVLVIAAACGGGGDEEAAPTATPTTAPPTSTPAPTDGEATPTPVPATPTPTSGGVAPSDGAPTPEPFTGGEEIPATLLELEMLEVGGSGQSGTAALIQIERKTKVSISITPGPPGVSQAAMIHRGRCADIDQKPQVDYLLFNIVDGESVSLVNTPTQFFQFNKAFIVVYQGETVDTPVASCGDVPSIF